jgi:hypothetical protein
MDFSSLLGAIRDSLGTNSERCLRFWQMGRIHNLAHSNFASTFAHRQSCSRGVRHDVTANGFFGVGIEHGSPIDLM